MSGPTPRQQAGYLRRLLRRGEIEVVDPSTGRLLAAMIELHADVIRIVPMLESPKTEVRVSDVPFSDDAAAFAAVVARLRRALTLEQIEEIASAVEAELGRAGDIDPPVT
ncbi:MAG TPA: hypothetical protein VMR50_06060 [Myxococcota bacterium]|nr:hypothetical protein [Myxococcota bacterium]